MSDLISSGVFDRYALAVECPLCFVPPWHSCRWHPSFGTDGKGRCHRVRVWRGIVNDQDGNDAA